MKLKKFENFINEMAKSKPKLNDADQKFLKKFLGDKLKFDSFSTDKITRRNPYSGEVVDIDPISAVCYDLAIELYTAWENQDEVALKKIHPDLRLTNVVQNFDRAKYIVMKMDPDAYYSLLD